MRLLLILTMSVFAFVTEAKTYTPEEIKAESERINKYFEEDFKEELKNYPTFLTYIGSKERYDELNDESYEFAKKRSEAQKIKLKKLKEFNYDALDEQTKISYDLYKQEIKDYVKNFKFFYHSYVVNQHFSFHTSLASFMFDMHSIANKKDAEDYISRLRAFPKSFDQALEVMKTQEELGIKYPNFIFPKAISSSKNLISGFPIEKVKKRNPFYDNFRKKISKIKLKKSEKKALLKAAREAVVESIKPSYEKLISYLTGLEKISPENNGVWALPNGKKFYRQKLKRQTTSNLSPQKVHKIGLSEVARIQGEMKDIMKKVEFKSENLNDFFDYVKNDKKFYFPSTKAGRAAYLARTNEIVKGIRGELDSLFIQKPKAKLKIKKVEAYREKSAGTAFYMPPAINGSRPGVYYVNLYDMSAMGKHEMEALIYHEALPGHHMQASISQGLAYLPMFRRVSNPNAYTEGWGLYAEKLPKELGFYKDPYSDFGRLSLELWRAARLVVDTGIHHYGWSKEKTIGYLKDNTAISDSDVVKEVERYFVDPGQATSYKIGQLKILELRALAQKKLKKKYDIRDFHDQILKYGAVPLPILEKQVKKFIVAKKKAS